MIRVGVLGAGGKMGAEVCRAVEGAEQLELAAAVSPRQRGKRLGEVAELAASEVVVAAELDALSDAGVEVAVDFTNAEAAVAHLSWCCRNNIHVVSGTTGIAGAALADLAAAFAPDGAPNAVLCANFSITAVLLMRFAELAAPFLDGVEIVELHHERKRDAPSGTALETARRIAAARDASGTGPFVGDPTTEEVLAGARGGLGPMGIRLHAVRLPGLVAHEEVLFGGAGQALTIRQDSFDRTSFMPGVLLAIEKVAASPGLTIGLEPLLDLSR